VHRDGAEFSVRLSTMPVADRAGRSRHWVAIPRDTTAREQGELALRALLENSVDLVLAAGHRRPDARHRDAAGRAPPSRP